MVIPTAFLPRKGIDDIDPIIARFEPRLKEVRAILTDPGNNRERTVRFHIEAKMCIDPAPEVAFDTILELTTGHYSIKPSEA